VLSIDAQTAEAELLAEFVGKQSEQAFAELVRRHLPMVLGVCRRVLEDDHSAQDAAQAVFLALARKAKTLGRERALGGWLHHVAICTARNERIARARRLRREQEAAAMQQAEAEELTSETVSGLREWLDGEIDALPAKYRRSLVLVHLEGRSLEEAANTLGCKDGTLRVWLNRARQKLRDRLVRRGVAVSVPALAAWLASNAETVAATVPPDLGAAAVKNATLWAAGGTAAVGLAPNVVALAKGAIHTMFMAKLKTAAIVTASVATLATASAVSWQKVYEARDKGLPKTAIEELRPIIVDAMQNRRHAEAIKAIAMKIALEGKIEGSKPEEKIIRMQAEVEKAPAEMKPLMDAILAHWYWEYFQNNRWQFQQRTQTTEAPGKDFTAWDLPRILAEIDARFTAALANEQVLKATPIGLYTNLLEHGTAPDTWRPTLYDFLAHAALQFYQAGEQGAASAEDEFEVSADSPVFGTVAEFLKWQPATTDTNSPNLRAIKLFQNLLTFHAKDADKTAFIDADLWRLTFGKNQAAGEGVSGKYKAALRRFADEWADHEISARALFQLASVLNGEGNPAEARALAQRGATILPQSIGGNWCSNLVRQIEAEAFSIKTERVWNEPWPVIGVTYRNLTNASFRAIPYNFETFIARHRRGFAFGSIQFEDIEKEILALRPAAEWSVALPATSDFKQRDQSAPVPHDLKPGFYCILASPDASFTDTNRTVGAAFVWVSELALVIRPHNQDGFLDGFVLKAGTGEPVAGAAVQPWIRRGDDSFVKGSEMTTDSNGMFRFTGNQQQLLLLARKDGQSIACGETQWIFNTDRERPDTHTVFFTDRSLYRPGQTIQYKGICYRTDREKNDYRTLGGQTLTVALRDLNGKEVARAQHKCNDYGSFAGSFTAPAGRGTGQMYLQVDPGPQGSAYVNVEEYKRPKFQVELERPKEAAKLGAEVVVTGKATSYTGAAIGGAKVKWRVTRNVRLPSWCWWGWACMDPDTRGQKNIAHGTATTAADGSFSVRFVAAPDLAAAEKTEPVFAFQVDADVTDSTGETRSGSYTTRAGYAALQATLDTEEWQTADKPVAVGVATSSLDGEPQDAAGTLTVYALKQPEKVARASLLQDPYDLSNRTDLPRGGDPKSDPANPETWELAEVVAEQGFKTGAAGRTNVAVPLKVGIYRAVLETKDQFGKAVTALATVRVVDLKNARHPVKVANHFAARSWSVEPGENFLAVWGTGYESGRAFVELEQRGRVIRAWWTAADRTQEVIENEVTEAMRGGFTLRVTYIRENRAYLVNRVVDVPWSNKDLSVRWEHFTSKLEPGRKETWTAVVSGPDAKAAVAEMVAGLYDASLDQFMAHAWMQGFNVFRSEYVRANSLLENGIAGFQIVRHVPAGNERSIFLTYRRYPTDIVANFTYYDPRNGWETVGRQVVGQGGLECDGDGLSLLCYLGGVGKSVLGGARPDSPEPTAAPFGRDPHGWGTGGGGGHEPAGKGPDLSKVSARKNLNETAFFFPQLVSDSNGVVRMEFTMPEALTEWKFMAFAHDRDLRSGYLQDKAVTSKELMVEPNPPRFVREGDTIEFTVKVSNKSVARQTGKVRLSFADARTLESVDARLGAERLRVPFGAGSGAAPGTELSFDIASKESKSFAWRLSIPDGCDFLTYKAVGATDRLSDGEEGYLPVLSRRILVTESLPLPIRGAQTKKFEFAKLIESGKSKTLKSENLTVQMVSQPAWYAVMALPYLMEYPHECMEQTFNRFYANVLGRHIAGSDPKIRRVFDQWKNTPAMDSPMEKNQDLKSVMIEETPWLRQAQDESQARRNVGILFDGNRLDNEARQTFAKLAQTQNGDGLWPWFPGCRGDEYITLYIVTGFGRLRHLGVKGVDMGPAIKAFAALDGWMDRRYREIMKSAHPEEYVPGYTDAFYLYGRSFFLQDRAIDPRHKAAVDFFQQQARKFWVKVDSRQSQGHLAIALKRFGDAETPAAIMKSIKEYSVSNEEMGMFWRDTELSWWWYRAPIETQALMIEAFDEVAGDAQAVEDCRVWLLKQKQTQDWKTTKATADAVYGLLLRGKNLLGSDALVEVSLGGEAVKSKNVDAGTGFYEERFVRKEIKPDMGKIVVKKTDEGVSWGSVHWQYLEDMSKVTPYEGTPLKLKKAIYVKETTRKGAELRPVKGAVGVGDEVVVRVELRVDRDMEYVHLKDQRGSGTEPVNVLSRTRYQDGLSYYESTRDTASHFFIGYLPKGVYVFEYSVRVQLKGKYQTGIAAIQCMYAPEFNSHSESLELEVK
jgi:RNA polymerase sigma factor (sigma-70 family)